MSGNFTSLLAACAVTVSGLAITAPAIAKERPIVVTATEKNVPVRHVSYRDLNLAMRQDERRLVTRVRYAVRDVCVESTQFDPAFAPFDQRCRATAWQGARPQIDRAVARARDIATNGWSAIAPVAISISVR